MRKSNIRYVLIFLIALLSTNLTAQNLDLQNITVSTAESYSASSITAGPDVTIISTGDLTLNSNILAIKPKFVIISGGKFTAISGTSPVSIQESENLVPLEFNVKQNYPNPFNPTTQINYTLAKAGKVEIDIYSLTGQKVKTLLSEYQVAGNHSASWNGTDVSNNRVSSGVYFYKVTAGSNIVTKKMTLLK